MEPTELPEPEDHPIRRIVLTPASERTALRGAKAEGGFSDRSKGFSILVFLGALFISALWPAALFAFLAALLGIQGLVALGPEWWVMIAVGAVFPLPVIWLAVITWRKARDLSVEASRLGEVASRLLEPDQTAAQEIATIGMAIRREVETLSGGVESALEKVRSLEGAVAAQAMAIEQAAEDAESRAEEVRLRMEGERVALGEVATGLKALTDEHAVAISRHTNQIESVAEKARGTLDETTRHLDRQGQVLTQAVNSAVTDSKRVTESIELQVNELNRASDKALAMTDDLTTRYGEHLRKLEETAKGLGLENNKLETMLSRQKELLSGVSELITTQNGQILTAIDGGVSHLDEALKRTVAAARGAAEGFKSDIDEISESAGVTIGSITKAAERASFVAGEAQNLLDGEASRVRKILETQTAHAKDAMNGLFKDFEEIFESKSGALKSLSSAQVAVLKQEIEAVREAAKSALAEQSDEVQIIIQDATNSVKEASHGLSDLFERVIEASEKSNATLESTSGKVDNHLKTLPGLAEETTTRIRAVLDEELNAFARLADESARKIRSLNQAFARHVPGAPRPDVWGHGSGLLKRQPPISTAPGQPGQPGPATKNDWAWGDVLAAVDRPFDAPDESGGKDRPQSHEAEAFSKSSLVIFESLQAMAVDLDRALETDPPRDLLRRYLNGERETFTRRLRDISNAETATRIHDKYLEDQDFRDNVNQYIEQFEGLLNDALSSEQEDILIETFMSSSTGKVYFLLGGAIGHFG